MSRSVLQYPTIASDCQDSVLSLILAKEEPGNDETKPLLPQFRPLYSDTDQNETLGIFMLLISGLFFCAMTFSVRYVLVYEGISVPTIMLLLGSSQTILALLYAVLFSNPFQIFRVPRRLLPLLFVRGAVGGTAEAFCFLTLTYLNHGMTTSIYFTNPIFTMALSSMFLGENAGTVQVVAGLVTIIGVFFVMNPTLDVGDVKDPNYFIGVACGLVASGFVACTMICVRSLGSQIHYMSNVLAFGTGVTVLGVAMGGTSTLSLEPTKGLVLGTLGCASGFIGQCLFNKALQHVRAGPGSVVRTIDVPLAFVLGVVLLDQVPHFLSLLGAFLVVGGVTAIGVTSKREGR